MSSIIETGNKIGQTFAIGRVIVLICILCIAIPFVVKFVRTPPKYDSKTTGTVESIKNDKCERYTKPGRSRKDPDEIKYSCDITYTFTVNDKEYTNTYYSDQLSSEYRVGQTVTVYYKSADPSKNALNWISKRTIGLAILGFLLCMLCVSVLHLAATLMIPGYGTFSLVSSALSRN